MKLESQVVSLDLSKKLKELGVEQESYFWWAKIECKNTPELVHYWYEKSAEWHIYGWKPTNATVHIKDLPESISAFTVAELGEMLPKDYMEYYKGNKWIATLGVSSKVNGDTQADTEADSRAKMLIYLIEKGLLNA